MNCENPPEDEPASMTLSNGYSGNGLNTSNKVAFSNADSENGQDTSEEHKWMSPSEQLRMEEQIDKEQKPIWRKKYVAHDICIIIIIFFFFIIMVLLAIIIVMVTKTSCPETTVLSCPSKWVGYEDKCYYFSETEGTWNSSRNNCSASGASLAVVEDQKEMDFIMRYKGSIEHWFGLWREQEKEPWKWTNGSYFNEWFKVGANGLCAYLDDDSARSTWCDTQRNWICSKSLK